MANASRVVYLDSLKGVLILLVVLGHSIQASMAKLGLNCLDDYLWNLIYSFHMPAFISISGFLAYRKNVVGGGRFDWLRFTWRRFRQLMIPFFLWSVALFLVNRNVDQIYDYIIYPQKSLWFLWALFFIAVLFAGIDQVANKLKIRQEIAMVICWLILVGVMFVMPDAKLFGVEYVTYYFFYYVLGYYLHKYSEYLTIRNCFLIVVIGMLWFALGSIYSTQGLPSHLSFISFIPSSIFYYIYRILTACLAIIFMFSLGMKTMNEEKGVMKYAVVLGKVSLGIYAVHMVVRFRLVDAITSLIPGISYWLLMIVTFIMLVPLSYGIVWILGKWKPTSILLLGKLQK